MMNGGHASLCPPYKSRACHRPPSGPITRSGSPVEIPGKKHSSSTASIISSTKGSVPQITSLSGMSGATGNVATEDVVYMLEGLSVAPGVDMSKLVAATNVVSGLIGRPPVSRVAVALNAKARAAK